MAQFQIDTLCLDLGDLGPQPVVVDGSVYPLTILGTGQGYFQTTIEKAVLHLENSEITVTHLLSKAARVSICEALEAKYESEIARGA